MKTISFIFVSLLLLVSGCQKSETVSDPAEYVATVLRTLDPAEKQQIQAFFAALTGQSEAAYTLFGPKPWTIDSYSSITKTGRNLRLSFPHTELALVDGWAAWERHANLFPSDVYDLRCIQSDEPTPHCTIIVINKPAMEQVIGRNADLFRTTLGIQGGANELQQQILSTTSLLKACTDDNNLLGILLGYGTVNAKAFTRRSELVWYIQSLQYPPYAKPQEMDTLSTVGQFLVKYVRSGKIRSAERERMQQKFLAEGASAYEELNRLCVALEASPEQDLKLLLDSAREPSFAAIKSEPETQEWLAAYEAAHDRIPQLRGGENTLESILTRWMSNEANIL